MRYKVGDLEIRSENAAKSISQPARTLVAWLCRMTRVEKALDYGCGKLRYTVFLAVKSCRLTLVDSAVQVNRTQRIGGIQTTVKEYAQQHWPYSCVLSIEEFQEDQTKYDFILCANVLSAIPLASVRSAVFWRLAGVLKKKGRCLFVTQYRNSYFKEVAGSKWAIPHLDGWILQTPRGNFYYGILQKEQLVELVSMHGFDVCEAWTDGQSAYVLAGQAAELWGKAGTES